MSLDQNLFTLNVLPSQANPNDTDLIDLSTGHPLYRKRRPRGAGAAAGSTYEWSLQGPP